MVSEPWNLGRGLKVPGAGLKKTALFLRGLWERFFVIFGEFWMVLGVKMGAKIEFGEFFFRRRFRVRFRIVFFVFFRRVETLKMLLPSRRNTSFYENDVFVNE